MNVVRLGVMWQGVEPEKDKFNHTYLDVMRNLTIRLGNAGIYTIVDFHQDVLSRKFCGDGVPDYIVDEYLGPLQTDCSGVLGRFFRAIGICKSFAKDYKYPLDEEGYPQLSYCRSSHFTLYHTAPEVASAFDAFLASTRVHQRVGLYFEKLAQTFADVPSVLGYDLFNEPFPGDVYRKPWLLRSNAKTYRNLNRLYDTLHMAIRKFDREKIVFFEPFPFPGTFPVLGGLSQSSAFEHVPGGPVYSNRSAMSYHLYSCATGKAVCSTPTGDPKEKLGKRLDKFVQKKINMYMDDVDRIGGGSFLTEFGACSSFSSCYDELDRVTNFANQHFQSWAYWQYKYFGDVTTQFGTFQGLYHDDGSIQMRKVAILARPYARAIAGEPIRMHFDPKTRVFELTFTSHGGMTEIYVNRQITYPNGFDLRANASVSILERRNVIEISSRWKQTTIHLKLRPSLAEE